MGKPLKQQKRGKGSPAYRAPSHRYKAEVGYRKFDEIERGGKIRGAVMEFLDDPAHQAIVMRVHFTNGEDAFLMAPEGIALGDEIWSGANAQVEKGSVLPLAQIPEGMYVYNVELAPGDGGKLVRAPGSYAVVVSKEQNTAYVKMPSKQVLELQPTCRAQIGVLSGGGRLEMPLM
jgi:large subunit ribosomal protein L2